MRRALTIGVGTLVVLGGLVGLLAVFQARDEADVSGGTGGPGEVQPDRGAAHGESAGALDADDLPASGTHRPAAIGRDGTELTADEWLHALELGNVILAYGADEPPEAFVRVQEDAAGAFDPELAAAGQSVILAHVDGLAEPVAVAWRRVLRFQDPADPQVRAFIDAHLGAGAPR